MTSIESIKGIVYSIKCNINNKYYVGQTLSHNYNEKNKANLKVKKGSIMLPKNAMYLRY